MLSSLVIGTIFQFFIPSLFDVLILNFLLRVQKKIRLIIAAFIANALIFMGAMFVRVPADTFLNNFTASLLNLNAKDLSVYPNIALFKTYFLPAIFILGLFVTAAVKIFIYRRIDLKASLKDISLGVLISILSSQLINAVLIVGVIYYLR